MDLTGFLGLRFSTIESFGSYCERVLVGFEDESIDANLAHAEHKDRTKDMDDTERKE